MIITKPREWTRIKDNLDDIGAERVFIMGCGQCATVAGTGGQPEVLRMKAMIEQTGRTVTGWAVGEVTCHLGGTRLDARKHVGEIADSDAIVVLSCGSGVQTVAEATDKPVFPGLESVFLGNVVRHGVFEERCQMCGDCVLDMTAGICPVTTCPKGLLNGPCGGMWLGKCEVLKDRECVHVRIHDRLKAQGRLKRRSVPPKNYGAMLKPGSVNLRARSGTASANVAGGTAGERGE